MYDYLRRTGLSVGQRFGYDLFELYQEGTEERYKAAYGVEMPTQLVSLKYGDAVYVDLNGDGLIDQNDQKPLGYPDNPEILKLKRGASLDQYTPPQLLHSIGWQAVLQSTPFRSTSVSVLAGGGGFLGTLRA